MADRGPIGRAGGAATAHRIAMSVAALIGAALVWAVFATPSEGKLNQRSSRSAELGAPASGAEKVRCGGRSRHLISGGFANDSPWRHDENSTIAAFGSAPAGKRGWQIRAANFLGGRESITVSALCSRRNPRVRVLADVFPVPPAGKVKETLRCPKGREAITGGFDAPGFAIDRGPEVIAFESRRKGRRKWRVSAYNNSSTIAGEIAVSVSCAKRRPRLRKVRATGVAVDQAPLVLAPRCGPGQELWSGGFVADFQSFDPFALILADRSYPDGKRWVSRFVGMQTGGEVTALAYCRERR
jgi:hypothetical protein